MMLHFFYGRKASRDDRIKEEIHPRESRVWAAPWRIYPMKFNFELQQNYTHPESFESTFIHSQYKNTYVVSATKRRNVLSSFSIAFIQLNKKKNWKIKFIFQSWIVTKIEGIRGKKMQRKCNFPQMQTLLLLSLLCKEPQDNVIFFIPVFFFFYEWAELHERISYSGCIAALAYLKERCYIFFSINF